ncbi:hypothetical protein [Agromyces mangrovi Wang et al. 2018]|uniref:hypothetical protein n=1 Tax=Agromyces mangrovi TaxID=1858653 RepID=UPI002574818C|nr:hypothetical protein [Agromyces mangrovi]
MFVSVTVSSGSSPAAYVVASVTGSTTMCSGAHGSPSTATASVGSAVAVASVAVVATGVSVSSGCAPGSHPAAQ